MQMRYQGVVKIIPICTWVTLVAMVGGALVAPPVTAGEWFFYSLLVMVTATLVAWLTLEVFRSKVGVNDSHLVITKNVRRMKRIPWANVEQVAYHRLWSSFVVITDTGERYYISTMMTHLKDFLAIMAAVLPREKYIDGIEKFAKIIGK